MRALLYTLVLSAVLVVLVVVLRSLPKPDAPRTAGVAEQPRVGGELLSLETDQPMVVHSDPAPLLGTEPQDLERMNIDALYATGVELFDLWHPREAIRAFEAVLAADPNHLGALLRLVECYSHPMIDSERLAEETWSTAAAISTLARLDSIRVSAFRNLFIDDMPSVAAEQFAEIVKRDDGNVDARVLLARALLETGDTAGARRYLTDLLDGDQSLGQARELLIQCAIIEGHADVAAGLAKDLISLYPEEPYPYVLTSRVALIEGDIDAAAELCGNALLLDQRYAPSIVTRAQVYVAQGDPEAARVSFEKLFMFDNAMLSSIANEGVAYVDFLYGRFHGGMERMDEAIRLAMSAGSTRRGMLYTFRLVDYLCELGRGGAAEAVLDRWVSRNTDVPAEIGQLRILISQGDAVEVRKMLSRVSDDERWRSWMRALSLDYADLEALALIGEQDFQRALNVLEASTQNELGTRRPYLQGYVLFQNGNAEAAVEFFEKTRYRLYDVIFPFHSDPILYVQSIFYLGEAALARGESEVALDYYRSFLTHWGATEWDLQAVDRAREKVEALASAPSRNP